MLQTRTLVIEHRDCGKAQQARDDRLVRRTVGQSYIEVATLRPAPQGMHAPGSRTTLADPRAPTMAANLLDLEAVHSGQLGRLPIRAGRQLDRRTTRFQHPYKRRQHQDVWRVGEVDPDAHRALRDRYQRGLERADKRRLVGRGQRRVHR